MSSPVAQKLYSTAKKCIKIQKQSSFLEGLRLRDFKKLGLQPWVRIQTLTPHPSGRCCCMNSSYMIKSINA